MDGLTEADCWPSCCFATPHQVSREFFVIVTITDPFKIKSRRCFNKINNLCMFRSGTVSGGLRV